MTSSRKTTTKSSVSTKRYRLGAYVRLSPTDEVREEGSLVSHPQRIRSLVDFKNGQEPNWGEIVEIYTDKDYSGKDTNRPAFRRLLEDIKYGRINAVIVTELSRISRDVKDFCHFWEFIKLHRGTFISLKENFDTTTPIGEMMVIQAISFAQFERKTIVTRIKDGARARAERGLWIGGQRILGYDLHPTKRGHLVVTEAEATIVRLIFAKFLECGSLAKTRDWLNAAGYRTKSYITKDGKQIGGNLWSAVTLLQLLTNGKFIGKVEVNGCNKEVPEVELAPHERYKVVEASWPAIISEELFREVEERLATNKRYGKRHLHLYRLSGLVTCGVCGREMSGQAANGKGGKYFYYGHSRKFSATGHRDYKERCELERLPAVRLEEAVVARVLELARDKKLLTKIVADSGDKAVDHSQELDQLIASREQERRNLDRMIDNLLGALADLPTGVNAKTILGKVAEYEKQRDQVAGTLGELRAERAGKRGKVIQLDQVQRLFRLFQKDFSGRPAQEQRDILREVVKSVTVLENGLRILYYAGPQDRLTLNRTAEETEEYLLGRPKKTKPLTDLAAAEKAGTMRSGVRSVLSMVGVAGFEPTTSRTPSVRATNCATPRLDTRI